MLAISKEYKHKYVAAELPVCRNKLISAHDTESGSEGPETS